jgi:hypothetical protein
VLDIACLQRSQDSLEKERKILTCISPPVEGKSGEFPLANPRDDLGKIQLESLMATSHYISPL